MAFEPIRKILPNVVRSHGLTRQLQTRDVLKICQRVLVALWGNERADLVTPVSYREGTLTLGVRSAAAMQQLRLDETRILNEINRQLEQRIVTVLHLRGQGF